MNSSSFIDPSVFIQNSTIPIVESWFIPLAIFQSLGCILSIMVNVLLLLILILDKTCHTVPMMLISNSYVAGLIGACNRLGMAIFTLQNDLKQIQYQDSLCDLRIYLLFVTGAGFYSSFLLQALYRYLIVFYPNRLLFQSFRFQILMLCLAWLYSFVYPFAFQFNGQIIYSVDNQICELPFSLSFSVIYMISCVFLCPISLIMLIYLKLIRHVREMDRNLTAANTLIRAQRALKAVRRTVMLIIVLGTLCFPFTVMVFLGFFNHSPKYDCRIAYTFVDFAGLTAVVSLFQFTDPLKAVVTKIFKWRSNQIVATMT